MCDIKKMIFYGNEIQSWMFLVEYNFDKIMHCDVSEWITCELAKKYVTSHIMGGFINPK